MDEAWVTVKLLDVNDNPPIFSRPHTHVSMREDTPPNTLVASLPAHDPDMDGQQRVEYHVDGGWVALRVDEEGNIKLWRRVDRESYSGPVSVVRVVCVDTGNPPLSSTATLTLSIIDVNDCPPTLLPPTVLHVVEESSLPTMLGVLRATDADVWALGHGPPFNFSLDQTNPSHITKLIRLNFNSKLESGRGGGEVWTTGGIDREVWPILEVRVRVSDAKGLAATHTLTIIVDDLNDNPMKPGAKTVYLWKTQGGGWEAPLGRVYVEDPDDWDGKDKTYNWAGLKHPLFSLDTQRGDIFASSLLREGRYELQFVVSDRVWKQEGVLGNVSVVVRDLPPDAPHHAAPITLSPATPTDVTLGWSPQNRAGGLGRLIAAVEEVMEEGYVAQVVSVYPCYHHQHHQYHRYQPTTDPHNHHHHPPPISPPSKRNGTLSEEESGPTQVSPRVPATCVWLSVLGPGSIYMDPVKLQGLLSLHAKKVINK